MPSAARATALRPSGASGASGTSSHALGRDRLRLPVRKLEDEEAAGLPRLVVPRAAAAGRRQRSRPASVSKPAAGSLRGSPAPTGSRASSKSLSRSSRTRAPTCRRATGQATGPRRAARRRAVRPAQVDRVVALAPDALLFEQQGAAVVRKGLGVRPVQPGQVGARPRDLGRAPRSRAGSCAGSRGRARRPSGRAGDTPPGNARRASLLPWRPKATAARPLTPAIRRPGEPRRAVAPCSISVPGACRPPSITPPARPGCRHASRGSRTRSAAAGRPRTPLIQPAVSYSTLPTGNSSRRRPPLSRATARLPPSGAQSAVSMSSRISRGAPPPSGTRASVPRLAHPNTKRRPSEIAISPFCAIDSTSAAGRPSDRDSGPRSEPRRPRGAGSRGCAVEDRLAVGREARGQERRRAGTSAAEARSADCRPRHAERAPAERRAEATSPRRGHPAGRSQRRRAGAAVSASLAEVDSERCSRRPASRARGPGRGEALLGVLREAALDDPAQRGRHARRAAAAAARAPRG